MKSILSIIAICSLLITSSCSSVQNTYSEVSPDADFTVYNSYKWIPSDSTKEINILYESPLVGERIKTSANNELTSRGLNIENTNPDLLIQYTIIIEKEEKVVNYPVYSFAPTTTNQGTYPNQYPNPGIPEYPYNYSYNNSYNPLGNYQYEYINTFNYPFWNYYGPNTNTFRPVVIGNNFQQVEFDEGTLIIDVIESHSNNLVWRGWSQGNFSNPVEFNEQVESIVEYIFQRFPISPDANIQEEGITVRNDKDQ